MGWMITTFVKVEGKKNDLLYFIADESRNKMALESRIDDSNITTGVVLWQWSTYNVYTEPIIQELSKQHSGLKFHIEIISEEMGMRGEQRFEQGKLLYTDVDAWDSSTEDCDSKFKHALSANIFTPSFLKLEMSHFRK